MTNSPRQFIFIGCLSSALPILGEYAYILFRGKWMNEEEMEKRLGYLEFMMDGFEERLTFVTKVLDKLVERIKEDQAERRSMLDILKVLQIETQSTNEYVRASAEKIESANKIFKGY